MIVHMLQGLLLFAVMMNNIKDRLAEIHGELQNYTDSLKGVVLVLVDTMSNQSMEGIVKLQPAILQTPCWSIYP